MISRFVSGSRSGCTSSWEICSKFSFFWSKYSWKSSFTDISRVSPFNMRRCLSPGWLICITASFNKGWINCISGGGIGIGVWFSWGIKSELSESLSEFFLSWAWFSFFFVFWFWSWCSLLSFKIFLVFLIDCFVSVSTNIVGFSVFRVNVYPAGSSWFFPNFCSCLETKESWFICNAWSVGLVSILRPNSSLLLVLWSCLELSPFDDCSVVEFV